MDKNEELQKWLNDDRYVQTKELMILWGVTQDCVGGNLRKHNIKPSKIFHIGQGGFFCFYEKKQCLNLELGEKVKEFREALNDNRYVQASDLAKQWGVSKGAVLSFLKSHKILPRKTLAAYASCGGGNRLFFDKHQCESTRNELKDGSIELNDWRNSDKHITVEKLAEMYNCSISVVFHHFRKLKIKAEKTIHTGYNKYCFYDKKKAILVMSEYSRMMKNIDECESNASLIQIKDLAHAWGLHVDGVRIFLKRKGIKSAIRPCASRAYYDRAECERARPFINQPEKKEVEKVEEKQMELPKTTEQTPDIIPADTIDLFTMSELEAEFKKRGVELTAEVRAKINASDMPEMQHIATMLRGNTKTIAIRLSVLNEIAGQLRDVQCGIKNESSDEIGKPRLLWLDMQERVVFEFLRYKAKYTPKRDIVEHFKATRQPMDDSAANRAVWAAISALRDMGCLDAQNGCFMINSNYTSTEAESREVWGRMDASKRKTDPVSIDIGLENGKPINDKIKESGWYTVGIISEISGKSESWLRSHLPIEDCLIEYGNNKLIKVWMPKKVIQWLNDRNIFVQGWGNMKKYPSNGMRKYKPVFDQIAFDMASQNKSDIEISKRLDVTIETFNKYKKEIPSFSNAINSGMAAYVTSITSPQSKTETTNDKGICINQDLRDKLRFMAMADNVDLVTKLESIITAAWLMGNYENK
jgi:hypothetical protein